MADMKKAGHLPQWKIYRLVAFYVTHCSKKGYKKRKHQVPKGRARCFPEGKEASFLIL